MGQMDSIEVRYEGAPNSSGFGAYETTTHAGKPVMWTLSEPYGAKTWWPCKQDLTDKIDSIDIFVQTPALYKVGSNGKLMSEKTLANQKTSHWKHRYPIATYLISLAITDYVQFSDYAKTPAGDSIEILNYVYAESLGSAVSQLGNTVAIMELFNELFGLYPFADEKYGHAEFGWGGGMEHQAMRSMGSFSYNLQAHELAHQWFGDKVTCGTWEDIWLNEGFATYLTGLNDEYLKTPQDWYNWKAGNLNRIVGQPNGSVWVDDTTSVSRIFSSRLSYSKGAYLLHMLRWQVGDTDFYQAVRNYLNDPKLAYGYARTAELKRHLEVQSGQNLTEFFEDWFYGQGYPSYTVTWNTAGNKIAIQLDQTTSDASVDFFEMPVPVRVSGQGRDSVLRLDHAYSGQVFEVEVPFAVDAVSFDPALWLISANNTVSQGLVALQEPRPVKLSVFPNPAHDRLEINLSALPSTQNRSLQIYDSFGRMVFEKQSLGNITKVEVPVTQLNNGVYVLRLMENGRMLGSSVFLVQGR